MVEFFHWAVQAVEEPGLAVRREWNFRPIEAAANRLLSFLNGHPIYPEISQTDEPYLLHQALEFKAWLQTFVEPWEAVSKTIALIPVDSTHRRQALAACLSEYCGRGEAEAVDGLLLAFSGNEGLREAFKWLLERGRKQEAESLILSDSGLYWWLQLYKREQTEDIRQEIQAQCAWCKEGRCVDLLWGFMALVQERLEGEFELCPLTLLEGWDQGWTMLAEHCYQHGRLDVLADLHERLDENHPLGLNLAMSYLLLDPEFCFEFGEWLISRRPE